MILVTGADGFVGSNIIERLVKDGERTRALVRNLARARTRLSPDAANGAELVQGDTTQLDTLPNALAGVDTVIHAAFITANRKQEPGVDYYKTNVTGTKNLVAAAKNAGVQRIVVMGGLGTKPDKPGSYMQGRYEADHAVKNSGLAWSILGPSVQFGSHSAFFDGLADLIRSAPVVPMVGDGKVKFQPIWVRDVATCILKMVREPQQYDGNYIEIGGPEIYTYAQILDLLMDTLGTHKVKVPGPRPFVAIGAALMELVLPNPPITRAAVGLFDFDNVAAIDSVQRNFGFTPLSLRTYLTEHGLS
ncbi:MAG: SDR family oxidoreductase [Ktedonobacterales bacterium]